MWAAKNPYTINGDGTITIELTQGKTTRISEGRAAEVFPYRWFASRYNQGSYRAATNVREPKGRTLLLLHRLLTNVDSSEEVDHIDFDPLNNTDENLRVVSHAQNQQHRRLQSNNTSGYKGVCWNRVAQKWGVRVWASRRCVTVGYFTDVQEAALAYDEAARRVHGPFVVTNESLGLFLPVAHAAD